MKITLTAYRMQLNHFLQAGDILNHFPVALIFVNKEYS